MNFSVRLGNGWATPVPPFITYPVQNIAWGDGEERPPFAPAKLVPKDQAMLAPPAPAASSSPAIPAPAPALIPPTGPIPVQDWFNLLRG